MNRVKMRAIKPMLVGHLNVDKGGPFETFEQNARLLESQGYAERDDGKASRKAADDDEGADRKPPPAPAARKAPAPK